MVSLVTKRRGAYKEEERVGDGEMFSQKRITLIYYLRVMLKT